MRFMQILIYAALTSSCSQCVEYFMPNKKRNSENLPNPVDFFTHFGAPFSALQYSFSPQTIVVQLAPTNIFQRCQNNINIM